MSVPPSARILFHPALLARRAAEIAESQGGRIGRDARGRPFVVAGADPLAAATPLPAPPATDEPMRFMWLIQKLCALRWPARPSVGDRTT